MTVYMCGILLITTRIILANLERGSNGWPFLNQEVMTLREDDVIFSVRWGLRWRPSQPAKMRRMARNRLLFSRRSCATGLRWLGCADHPFLVIRPVGDPWVQKRRRRQTMSRMVFGAVRTATCQIIWATDSSSAQIGSISFVISIFFTFAVSFIWENFGTPPKYEFSISNLTYKTLYSVCINPMHSTLQI